MDNLGKVVSKEEVTSNLLKGLLQDQQEFKAAIANLKHGQKQRLMEAMVVYPLEDVNFEETEPEMRVAVAVWKRISDSLVAFGTEAAIEGILQGIQKQQETNGENNEQG